VHRSRSEAEPFTRGSSAGGGRAAAERIGGDVEDGTLTGGGRGSGLSSSPTYGAISRAISVGVRESFVGVGGLAGLLPESRESRGERDESRTDSVKLSRRARAGAGGVE